jgi:arylsulfatase A-like enzyme
MNRRYFLSLAPGASAWAKSRRVPNIVLIMADDLGYECLAVNGALDYRTPNLDRLAEQGVRFTNAHSTPLCTPTRVQLMTGKYNFRNYTEFGCLPPGERTFAHQLQQAGYRTAVIGKWQLAGPIEGTGYRGQGTLPEAAGFDEHCLWQVQARGSRYWDPLLQINGELGTPRQGEYGPDVFAQFGESFIERHRRRPFLLYYPMVLTHNPFVPTPRSPGLATADKVKDDPRWFGDMVAYMDHQVGRIVRSVERHGLLENTLILFTGDNGTHPSITTRTRSGPYQGGKGGTTAAGTHVPLIAAWKGTGASGVVCEDLIDFTDFFPTLAEVARARMPGGHPGDGRSFLSQISGHKGKPRDHIFCHYDPRWASRRPARWVMDKRWKLYQDGRFFDLARDPLEKGSPVDIPTEAQPVVARFRSILEAMR